jgi:hydrogenase nickel incorporation protein HypA/HybF
MHELGIIQTAIAQAVHSATRAGAARVHRLRLTIGTLSGVVPDSLRFAFELACRNTPAQGACLEIQEVAPACWCEPCQSEFPTPDFLGECPRCHTVSSRLTRGTELELTSVEVS